MKLTNQLVLVLSTVAALLGSGLAWAAPSYSLTALGSLGGRLSLGTDINNLGQVVGYSHDEAMGTVDAFIYSGGNLTNLGLGSPSFAFGINDAGMITGKADNFIDGRGSDAFIYSGPGNVSFISQGDLRLHYGVAINNLGQVIGSSLSSERPAIASSSQSVALIPQPLLYEMPIFLGGDPNDINDIGQVVGAVTSVFDGRPHPFLYSSGQMTVFSEADANFYAINSVGQIAGVMNGQAILYGNGVISSLGTLGTYSYAAGLNDSGQVVGDYFTENGGHSFLFTKGSLLDLDEIVTDRFGWKIRQAVDINNRGQILVNGWHAVYGYQALLLNPIPEPETYAMMLAGLVLLGVFARRRKQKLNA